MITVMMMMIDGWISDDDDDDEDDGGYEDRDTHTGHPGLDVPFSAVGKHVSRGPGRRPCVRDAA